jgi:hypothetical protein
MSWMIKIRKLWSNPDKLDLHELHAGKLLDESEGQQARRLSKVVTAIDSKSIPH